MPRGGESWNVIGIVVLFITRALGNLEGAETIGNPKKKQDHPLNGTIEILKKIFFFLKLNKYLNLAGEQGWGDGTQR